LIVLLAIVATGQLLSRRATIANAQLPNQILLRDVFTQEGKLGAQLKEFTNIGAFLALIVIFGFPIATLVFVTGSIGLRSPKHTWLAAALAFGLLGIMWVLALLITLQYPVGLISNFVELPWWLSGH